MLDDLKTKSKELGVTINDILMTLTSVSIKEYLLSKGDTNTKQLGISVPFSLRHPPETPEDFQIMNDFAMVNIELDLVDNFDDGLKKVTYKMNKLK